MSWIILIGIDASDSEINILHNGYAGLYVQAVIRFSETVLQTYAATAKDFSVIQPEMYG